MSYENPSIGDTMNFGSDMKIFTYRGWVLCEDQKELAEEEEKIRDHIFKGNNTLLR